MRNLDSTTHFFILLVDEAMPFQELIDNSKDETLDRIDILLISYHRRRTTYAITKYPFLGIISYINLLSWKCNIKNVNRIPFESSRRASLTLPVSILGTSRLDVP